MKNHFHLYAGRPSARHMSTIHFRAKKNLTPECIPTDGILVDRLMNSTAF